MATLLGIVDNVVLKFFVGYLCLVSVMLERDQ